MLKFDFRSCSYINDYYIFTSNSYVMSNSLENFDYIVCRSESCHKLSFFRIESLATLFFLSDSKFYYLLKILLKFTDN